MDLTPTECDRLLVFTAAQLARRRAAAGVALNLPEATALVADAVHEAARAGGRLADALAAGSTALDGVALLPAVPQMLPSVVVESVFDDGTHLVVVPEPASRAPAHRAGGTAQAEPDTGERARQPVVVVDVVNHAPVPVTVTSHYHFLEVNPRLRFDRAAGYGRHLALPAGRSTTFLPGEARSVGLVDIAGDRVVIGFSGLVDGPLDAPGARERALHLVRACGFADTATRTASGGATGTASGTATGVNGSAEHAVRRALTTRADQAGS